MKNANQKCPCGSGLKIKKCEPFPVDTEGKHIYPPPPKVRTPEERRKADADVRTLLAISQLISAPFT